MDHLNPIYNRQCSSFFFIFPEKSFGIDLPNTILLSFDLELRTWRIPVERGSIPSTTLSRVELLVTSPAANSIYESWIWNCFKSVPPETHWWCLVTVTNLYWIRSWFHFGNPDELSVRSCSFPKDLRRSFRFSDEFHSLRQSLLENSMEGILFGIEIFCPNF